MSELGLAKQSKPQKSMKTKVTEFALLAGLLLIIALIIYICVDASIDRDYSLGESQGEMDTSYKGRFEKLVSDVEEGNATGIPTLDDFGVTYGTRIDITKGVGDFAEIESNWKTSIKTLTYYNYWGDGKKAAWGSTSNQYTIAYSKLLHQKMTVYDKSGVVKLFDRYSLVALGSYWAEKLKLPNHTGATYRVFLDNGRTFDVMSFDAVNGGDSNAINDAGSTGKSIGHNYSGDVVIIEFDLLNLHHNYPVLDKQYVTKGGKTTTRPEMRYAELMQLKNDPSHTEETGSLNKIPEFEGNVIALQLIDDPKVKDLFNQATVEVAPLRNK